MLLHCCTVSPSSLLPSLLSELLELESPASLNKVIACYSCAAGPGCVVVEANRAEWPGGQGLQSSDCSNGGAGVVAGGNMQCTTRSILTE
jgi:hypothetical protein